MKWTTVMCDSLGEAQEVIDEATKSKVVIKIDYTWVMTFSINDSA